MKLKALYFDGQSPVEQEIEVEYEEVSGRWRLEGRAAAWEKAEVAMERQEDEWLVTLRSSQEFILVRDVLLVRKLDSLGLGSSVSWTRKLGLAASLVVLTFGLFAGFYASIRPLAYALARELPSEQERAFFDPFLPIAYLNESRCTQWDAQAMLQGLGSRLSEKGRVPPTVEILNWDMVNAFAFPGRRIYVTQGLLETLESSEQLLAVLAHEQAHVDLRHNLGETIQGALKAILWSLAIGDYSGAFIVDPKLLKDMSDASYSRAIESDADREGSRSLLALGHDPQALGEALLLIQDRVEESEAKQDDESYPDALLRFLKMLEKVFATHPAARERRELIRSMHPDKEPKEALGAEEWRFLKEACRSRTPVDEAP